jgi:protein-tyrosine phosphatase
MDRGAAVVNGVFIGSLETATISDCLTRNNIKAVINLSGVTYEPRGVPVLNILMDDTDIQPAQLDLYIRKFAVAVAAIERTPGNVLVHCAAGVNRSAAAIMFYLINTGLTYDSAYEKIRAANAIRGRPVLTNPSFCYVLKCYDSATRQMRSRAETLERILAKK